MGRQTVQYQVLYCRQTMALHRWRCDHLVFAVRNLNIGIQRFRELTGVEPVIGGIHEGLGTHNALFSLGDRCYFEIIARDPNQLSPPRIWMGMEQEPPEEGRLITWAVEPTAEAADLAKRV